MRTVCLPGQIPLRTLTVFYMVGGQPGLTNPPAVLTVQPRVLSGICPGRH